MGRHQAFLGPLPTRSYPGTVTLRCDCPVHVAGGGPRGRVLLPPPSRAHRSPASRSPTVRAGVGEGRAGWKLPPGRSRGAGPALSCSEPPSSRGFLSPGVIADLHYLLRLIAPCAPVVCLGGARGGRQPVVGAGGPPVQMLHGFSDVRGASVRSLDPSSTCTS